MELELTAAPTAGGSVRVSSHQANEPDLIRRCQAGDRMAFEPIVHRYMRRAASFALGWTGNQDDALDLSQEAFVRAFRGIDRFDPARPFYPWLHRILRNLCVDHLGRARRNNEAPLTDALSVPSNRPSPLERAEREELRRTVWMALRMLKADDREILILREFQGLTYAEIAAVLSIPKGTVMSRLHSARQRLSSQLQELFPERFERRED